MSAGSSSQEAACFSVERTKYLMLSKSIPDRSAPQVGIGLRLNNFNPLSRSLGIHSGSDFFAEITPTAAPDSPRPPSASDFFAEIPRTTASDSPRSTSAAYASASAQPKR